ncbi:MAG: hypothetical protein RL329_2408 [Bacteroidota bacterium]|jgi:predicted RNA-binding protein (virulence factor B family)
MPKIGQYELLEVVKVKSFGAYLNGGALGEILLPIRYCPRELEAGNEIRVFLYCDSEDRVIATTDKPFAVVGEFAYLRVKDTSASGVFLDWGLMKDLFVPFREQADKMLLDKSYLVKIIFDEKTDRIIATSKINKFLKAETDDLKVGQEVKIVLAAQTDLGFRVIVDDLYWGVLYQNEVFQKVKVGDTLKGYVKTVREDKRIDVRLQKSGYEHQIPETSDALLNYLKKSNHGFIPLTDSSSPELIYKKLQMSKKNFKKSVGNLYKQRLITIETEGIRLVVNTL